MTAPLMRVPMSIRLMLIVFSCSSNERRRAQAASDWSGLVGSGADVMRLLIDRRGACAGAAVAEQRAFEFVERIDHALHGFLGHAHRGDRHMGDLKADLL